MIFNIFIIILACIINIYSANLDYTLLEQIGSSQSISVKALTAKERLQIVHGYLEQDPCLTMTKACPQAYKDIYLKDLLFVRDSIQKEERFNKSVLLKLLKILDDIVSERYKSNMTFADLNHIGLMFARVLSLKAKEVDNKFFETDLAEYHHALETYKKYNMVDYSPYTPSIRCISAPGIIVLHVSMTGAVPLGILNEGFGFFVGKNAYSLDFLAVATIPKVSFDYLKGQTSFDSWYHDFEHLGRASRLSDDPSSFSIRTYRIAKLRCEIRKTCSSLEQAQTELAFFMLFHESQDAMYRITKEVAEMITSYQQILDSEIIPTIGFNSLEQYETYIKAAQNLKLQLGGSTTIDRYRSFLVHLASGLKILSNFAPGHDG